MLPVQTESQGDWKLEEQIDEAFSYGQAVRMRGETIHRKIQQDFLTHKVGNRRGKDHTDFYLRRISDKWSLTKPGVLRVAEEEMVSESHLHGNA